MSRLAPDPDALTRLDHTDARNDQCQYSSLILKRLIRPQLPTFTLRWNLSVDWVQFFMRRRRLCQMGGECSTDTGSDAPRSPRSSIRSSLSMEIASQQLEVTSVSCGEEEVERASIDDSGVEIQTRLSQQDLVPQGRQILLRQPDRGQ